MKTGAALVLSVAGILAAGSAALAVNTQVLNVSPPGTGNANIVLLPNGAVPPAPAVSEGPAATPRAPRGPAAGQNTSTPAKASPAKTGSAKSGATASAAAKPAPTKTAPASAAANAGSPGSAPSSSGSGGTTGLTIQPAPAPVVVVPVQPGDDKGGLRKAPEPGDDSGGSGGHGADD
ncbi:hypothetical protein [Arthrobacter globiformis]|uniref:Uncharacterized protein n=1 Tax=Arthrobacter globiformis TaxID=1665 RepID=A0A328HEV0_ARTGO|nr:hypothetical protein [Arthrobacter globiformis]RAM35533.1 hypothetical protein DBZ45_20230 [Arthrobacter globiformis]